MGMADKPLDACPFVQRGAVHECRAHRVVSFEASDSLGRPLPPALTCAWLTVGTPGAAAFYPRCGLGDDAARAEYVAARDRELEGRLPSAVSAAERGDGFPEAGVMLADDEGRYVAVNRRICELLRLDRDQLLKKSVWDLTPEVHAEVGRRMWREFVEFGESYGRYQLRCGDGRVRDFDFLARANVSPGLHVSILTPAD